MAGVVLVAGEVGVAGGVGVDRMEDSGDNSLLEAKAPDWSLLPLYALIIVNLLLFIDIAQQYRSTCEK